MLEEVGEGLSGSDDRLMRDPPRKKPLVRIYVHVARHLPSRGQASTSFGESLKGLCLAHQRLVNQLLAPVTVPYLLSLSLSSPNPSPNPSPNGMRFDLRLLQQQLLHKPVET